MKFRTEIEVAPLENKIDYHSSITAIGSCFAQNMASRLASAKFRVVCNPTGIVFNPLSAADAITRLSDGTPICENELHLSGSGWFGYDFHSSLSAPSAAETLARINAAIVKGHEALNASDRVIITFGTAWVYRLAETGQLVANCHKQPSRLFVRHRLSVEQIVERYDRLMENELAGKEVIFTVSPVRHHGDGLSENSLSKATLRLAVTEIISRHKSAHYFPAFEIMNDDLRDYRFYDTDMIHPSAQAIEYIWEKFAEAAISDHAHRMISNVERITAAAAHRPFNQRSEAYKEFCRKQLAAIDTINEVDLENERAFFMEKLQIK